VRCRTLLHASGFADTESCVCECNFEGRGFCETYFVIPEVNSRSGG
jgi:hypothetical protein